jgi:hypothetical protein
VEEYYIVEERHNEEELHNHEVDHIGKVDHIVKDIVEDNKADEEDLVVVADRAFAGMDLVAFVVVMELA